MMPAVPLPEDSGIKKSVEVKLKPGWVLNERRDTITSDKGEKFSLKSKLPEKCRVVHKIPELAKADPKKLSKEEHELRRYLQVIVSDEGSPEECLKSIEDWPGVEKVYHTPDVSLP
ncbi:MAG TPA: hypothetical protein VGO50_01970 [Pyrinomonadaceae bacterium]|jgi:hypothetical protein|nr:hypothetical protein [Pyrinomonadaceae bacterium]